MEYNIFYRIIDASGWLPQHRERIYIVGFKKKNKFQNWSIEQFPEFMDLKAPIIRPINLLDILEKEVPEKYTLSSGTWSALINHKKHHKSLGQGFGYSIVEPPFNEKITRTLSARYYKDGAEILIYQDENRPRRLTPLECCRLMGFPKEYQKYFERYPEISQPVSDNQAYRQFGNSVAVPVVTEIAKTMISKMKAAGAFRKNENAILQSRNI